MKKIILLLINISFAFCQTPLSGLSGYYGSASVASAGVSGVLNSIDSEQINPAGIMQIEPEMSISIIKYPVNIYAQSANYITKLKASIFSLSLRRINYGTFEANDANGVSNGTYSADDTWINTAYARRNNNLSYGAGGGLFLSNLESYNALAVVFSAGATYKIPQFEMRLGVSLSNVGLYLKHYTDYKEKLPMRMTFSAAKGLKYLPLEMNTDVSYDPANNKVFARFGGAVQLPYGLHIVFGINSDNFKQMSEYKNIKSLIGGSGIGLSFKNSQYNIMVGGYSYGTGGWIYGTSFGYLFQTIQN